METIKELFTGLDLDSTIFTEEVIDKMTVVMESQLIEVEKAIEAKLEEKYESELVEYKEFLENQLDAYLNEFTNEFVENNQEQIHESVKVKTAEKVLRTFKNIVEEFNIALSEESINDSVEADKLKEQLNAKVNENLQLKEQLAEININKLIEKASSEITVESTRNKFISIAEGLHYDSPELFGKKLDDLKESLSDKSTYNVQPLEESEILENQYNMIEESKLSATQKQIIAALAG
jgi:hypothetical protein